jgi:predicted RNase H-like HicB family nuclease
VVRQTGSHQIWKHPLLSGVEINLAGHDGADAHQYQERDVRDAVLRARDALRGATMNDVLRYSMRIEWSNEDQVFVVSLPEWGDLVHTHGATYEEALRQGKDLIEGLVAARQQSGEPLPAPRVFVAV